jgi:cation transport regulator ChaC
VSAVQPRGPDGRVWIFGYGSLVWRAEFPFEETRPATVDGFARRFWQGSTDHRGVPGAPGRVVTLVREVGARCFGLAYALTSDRSPAVLDQLDHRERGGYERLAVELEFPEHGDARQRGLVYVATPDNPNWLGPAASAAIARQVRSASGPSGANLDYVRRLAAFLRAHGAEDRHVFEIEALAVSPVDPDPPRSSIPRRTPCDS